VVKVAKVAVRHFLPAVQKKAVKVAKPALPLLPPFFRQVLKNVTALPLKKPALPLLPPFFWQVLKNVTHIRHAPDLNISAL
jgi:hypothetical protein